jgi:hypothetical protein
VLSFAPASIGDVLTESVFVGNPSKTQTVQFHCLVPFGDVSHLTVSPLVATLGPQQRVRVEIQFTGRRDVMCRSRVEQMLQDFDQVLLALGRPMDSHTHTTAGDGSAAGGRAGTYGDASVR